MNVLGLMVVMADDDPIKDKHFRALGDRELWEHAADALLSLGAVSQMVIITDTPDRFADDYQDGELVYERSRTGLTIAEVPPGMSRLHALAHTAEAMDYDAYAMVNPCCPFIEPRIIQMGLEAMGKRDDVHRLYSVTRHSGAFESPTREAVNGGFPFYEINRALTIFRRRALWPVEHLPSDTKNTIYKLGTDRIQGLNIQSFDDWEIAEALMSQRNAEKKSRPD